MSIREKGYHHWDGEFKSRRRPWWPITRLGIRLTFKRKFFKFVLGFSLLPSVVFLGAIYLSERLEDFRGMIRDEAVPLQVVPKFYYNYLTADFVLFMTVVILVFAAAGLVADDLKHNALQLYFSRPLSKRDYLLGKSAVVFFFVLLLTLVPGMLLIIFKLIFSGSLGLLRDSPSLPLAVAAYSALVTLFFAGYALLISSLSRNRRAVSLLIFGGYLFSDMLYGILYGIFRVPAVGLFSIKNNLRQAAAPLFGVKPPLDVSPGYSWAILLAAILAAVFILHRKIKEVAVIR